MPRLMVHVEGQTEEDFVNIVLAPHFYAVGYSTVRARLLGDLRARTRRGGIRYWESVRRNILDSLLQDPGIITTTMVDYYGLPNTWPGHGRARTQSTVREKAAAIEAAVAEDISGALVNFDESRFIPYVVMHEFEGLLFSNPDVLAQSIGRPDLAADLRGIRRDFQTPEEINDSSPSHPSQRMLRLFSGYRKRLMGVTTFQTIGLETIRRECPLFDRWVERLEEAAALG